LGSFVKSKVESLIIYKMTVHKIVILYAYNSVKMRNNNIVAKIAHTILVYVSVV
jgi:hypothetical protein